MSADGDLTAMPSQMVASAVRALGSFAARDATIDAAPADRHEDRAGFGCLFVQLETEGALSGDDVRVVEWGYEHRAVLGRPSLGGDERVVECTHLEAHLGAVVTCGLHLG